MFYLSLLRISPVRRLIIVASLLSVMACGYPDVPNTGPVAGTDTGPTPIGGIKTPTPSPSPKTGDDFNLGKDAQYIKLPDGLQYFDLKVGTGALVKKDDTANVQYTGWLANGNKFDSSRDHNQPFGFKLGAGQVIIGWDEGIPGMAVGGVRRLIIPSALAYGSKGQGTIPGNSDLVFLVELVSIGATTSGPAPSSTSTTVTVP